MGRGKEGEGDQGGHLLRTRGHGSAQVVQPDVFVLRFGYDLQAARCRTVLDAGCGIGRNSHYLAGLGFQVVALDAVAEKVAEARQAAPLDTNTLFVNGRLESLPFPSRSFDALVCTHVLEYMDSPEIEAALGEFRRVLKREGQILLVTAAKEGAGLESAVSIGENRYLFKRGPIEVAVHLADRAELDGWLRGLDVRETLSLSLEFPRPATINASWAAVASLRQEPKGFGNP